MCVSRASSLETRSEHAVRRPRSTSRPWAAATASSEGIAARDPPAAWSLMHTAVAPPAARSAHASATRSTAAERPSSASKVASTSAGSSAASPSGVTRNDGSATSGASGPSASMRRPWADERRDGHHRALPLVVDRRVRDLREALPEVRREGPCAAGQRRDRRVVAHRVDGVATGLRDRPEHQAQLLAGVAVQRVTRGEVLLGHGQGLALLAEDERVGHPARVRPRAGERARQLAVEEDAALGVDGEQLAGREARPPHRDALRQRHRARLGRDRDEPVGADGDAQRPEPVPVELRAARRAVGEHEPRGPVPGLGEHRVVAAHRPLVLVDARVVLPGRAERAGRAPRAPRHPSGRGARLRCRGAPSRSPRRRAPARGPGRARAHAHAPPSRRRCPRSC